jgi:hypothetical protein
VTLLAAVPSDIMPSNVMSLFAGKPPPNVWRLTHWLVGGAVVACGSASPMPTPQEAKDAHDTGTRLGASSPMEESVLAALESMPANQPRQFGDVSVTGRAPYHAASGRRCRSVLFARSGDAAPDRVACTDGKAWFFVPNVFEPAPPGDRK